MLGVVGSERGLPPGRRRQADTRLDAVRARLDELRERDRDAARNWAVARSQRLDAAQRHAAEAHAAAVLALASSAQAFRRVAEAHERVASVHERAALAGIGDVGQHEQQAERHRAAAAAERQRAERAQSLLPEAGPAERARVADGPGNGVAP